MKIKNIAIGLTALLLNFTGCGSDSNHSDNNTTVNKTMLLGWYLTGSDLESGDNAGTSDLGELLEGYDALTKEQQDSIDIKVVFGGANKDGWRGTKYADIDCLFKDAEDGEFGNDSCYLKEDPNGNMGDPQTLQEFISYLDGLGSYDKRMLNLWNHGAAYGGICSDENHKGDILELNELKEVLDASKSSFDMIGMDACLMANYSVAETVKDYATYLLASEELEPGHGWQYTDVITAMGQQQDKDMVTIGKKIIDSFVDSSEHKDTNEKTLSLIDLRKIEAISKNFDTLNDSLVYSEITTFQPTAYAMSQTKGYGPNSLLTLDFQGYMQKLALGLPDSNASISSVKTSIKESIVYNRYQKGMKGSTGMTIANPLYYLFNINFEGNPYKGYDEIKSLSEIWKTTSKEFVEIKIADKEKPVISNFEINCTNDNEVGTCMNISDNTLISKIHYNLFVTSGNDSFLKVNAIDYNENMDNSTYFFPNQENKTYMLCGEKEEGCNFFPLQYKAESSEYEEDIFTTNIIHNGSKAQLTLYVDFNDTLVDAEVTSYTSSGVLGRSVEIKKSDTIEYTLEVYNLDGTRRNDENISMSIKGIDLYLLTLQNLEELDANMTIKVNIELDDINGNKSFSPIF